MQEDEIENMQASAVSHSFVSSSSFFSLGDVAERALRGIGRIFAQKSATTGVISVLAISLNSLAMGIMCSVGAMLSTLTGILLGSQREIVEDGTLGLNGALTAAALLAFTNPDLSLAGLTNLRLWGWIALASAASTMVAVGLRTLLKGRKLPLLAMPFCLVTWVFLGALKQFPGIQVSFPSATGFPASLGPNGSSWMALLGGTLNGINGVFFQHGWIAAFALLVAIAVSSRRAALLALGGSFVAALSALYFGVPESSVSSGAFGVNGALTAIFLGEILPLEALAGWLYPLAGTLLATIFSAAAVSILQPLGLPVLLIPFVFVTWTLYAAFKGFRTIHGVLDPEHESSSPRLLPFEGKRGYLTSGDQEEESTLPQLSEGGM